MVPGGNNYSNLIIPTVVEQSSFIIVSYFINMYEYKFVAPVNGPEWCTTLFNKLTPQFPGP